MRNHARAPQARAPRVDRQGPTTGDKATRDHVPTERAPCRTRPPRGPCPPHRSPESRTPTSQPDPTTRPPDPAPLPAGRAPTPCHPTKLSFAPSRAPQHPQGHDTACSQVLALACRVWASAGPSSLPTELYSAHLPGCSPRHESTLAPSQTPAAPMPNSTSSCSADDCQAELPRTSCSCGQCNKTP